MRIICNIFTQSTKHKSQPINYDNQFALLPNTELPKNRMQNIIRRDVAGDLGKVIQGLADVYA